MKAASLSGGVRIPPIRTLLVRAGRAIREGESRDGSPLKPPMAFGWYKNINDEDMAALVAYLRSLKPLPFGGAPTAKP